MSNVSAEPRSLPSNQLPKPDGKPVLRAEWRHLAMINYEIDPKVVEPLAPAGTEIDFWEGKTYVSMVGFLFLNTRIFGMPIPWHINFEEVNLRFYVRRKGPEGWRRGVVFVRELVPRWAIAFVARKLYAEKYWSTKMSYAISPSKESSPPEKATYRWDWRGKPYLMTLQSSDEPIVPEEGSQPQFIAEHYWGYSAQPNGTTKEYRVDHPTWRVSPASFAKFEGDYAHLYGDEFAEALSEQPASAFWAKGSEVSVYQGIRLG
ncbi:MAG: DUF2071 domain-containing protein [Lacipirellulaceae bacterium]